METINTIILTAFAIGFLTITINVIINRIRRKKEYAALKAKYKDWRREVSFRDIQIETNLIMNGELKIEGLYLDGDRGIIIPTFKIDDIYEYLQPLKALHFQYKCEIQGLSEEKRYAIVPDGNNVNLYYYTNEGKIVLQAKYKIAK